VHGRKCDDPACALCRIFGTSVDSREQKRPKIGPTRLCVRDAFPSDDTLKRFVDSGAFIIETKIENSLNRITADTTPHPIERIPRGAQFDLEMLYGIYDMGDQGDVDVENLKQIYTALDLLEASVLGGGGSRGSGKIAFEDLHAVIKTVADYKAQASGDAVELATIAGRRASDVIAKIQEKFATTPEVQTP
jgi:CRISPR-associated protein Csm3